MTGPALPPMRTAFIEQGTLLVIPAEAWYHGDGELHLRVSRVLNELSRFYDDEIWIEGTALGDRPRWVQVLVRRDALTSREDST